MKNFKSRVLLFALFLLFSPLPSAFRPGLSMAAETGVKEDGKNVLALRVPFEKDARATATLPDGSVAELGAVRALPVKTNWPAYTASKWGTPGTVCATAVNAIHILVRVEEGRGRIFSIVPTVTVAPAAPQGAFFSIDCPAGTGIFGGFAPLTGSRVLIQGKNGDRRPLELSADGFLGMEKGEALLIESPLPDKTDTWMVDIENRPGGRVVAWTKRGPKVAARVVRPVGGVGRFGGTEFQEGGRIRASHTGVIDIATAPRGQVGGIQIMPSVHALTSSEMANGWKLTQWMIVAPVPGKSPLEGTPPLFKGTLLPGTQLGDRLPDLWSTYGRKPLVLGRFDGGPWRRLPPVSGKVDDALRSLTHLRIYYPFWLEPQLVDPQLGNSR
ncbi:MAG: hypothetical protein LBP21_01165 [Synergistaceae bacterium]|jgi:hypothetical protein|nr:hypothetical protein [Synergistaceae bacterium]